MDPPPPPADPTTSTSEETTTAPRIYTYHCLCTHLILASTRPLSSLARRAGVDTTADGSTGGLDRAYILPLPARPPREEEESDSESDSHDDDDVEGEGAEEEEDAAAVSAHEEDNKDGTSASTSTSPRRKRVGKDNASKTTVEKVASKPRKDGSGSGGDAHYALLISAVLDRRPRVVTRDDGFERRYLQRCGRCRVVVGYQLDRAQFPSSSSVIVPGGSGSGLGGGVGTEGEAGEEKAMTGRREDVVFLLPGGLVETEEMVKGEMPGEKEVGLVD